jgi:heme-degrading monooxygenase HmoA
MLIKLGKGMYILIWEYQIKIEHVRKFEEIYAANGAWAELFRKGEGYLGTELIRDTNQPHRYISIDRWVSSERYESFLSQCKDEYVRLDAECEDLTENETLLGRWYLIPAET